MELGEVIPPVPLFLGECPPSGRPGGGEVAEKVLELHRRGTEDAENLIEIALKTPSLRWKHGFLAPQGGVVYWLVGDHLGTTSVVLTGAGTQVVAESRHHPYGTERWRSGTFPTDYRYTGQRREEGLGLYRMGAR